MTIKAIVAQKGTREYFLAARALHRKDCLAQMVVDWYTPLKGYFGRKLSHSSFSTLSRAFSAHSAELPDSLVRSMFCFGIYARLHSKYIKRSWINSESFDSGVLFAKHVAKLKLPAHNLFFGYSYSSLEAISIEKSRGVFTVLDQIDPGAFEREIIRQEEEKWPGYVLKHIPDYSLAYERNKKEWDKADVIIVNSHWSKECIESKGCNPDKIEILPLAYENCASSISNGQAPPPPLKVLWLGRITLQKGIPYLVEAAKLLLGEPVEILIAGSIDISESAIDESPRNIKWLGSVSVDLKMKLYRSAHVFVLPTLSDGFAITQLEAFAHGLPVITTRHCGKVVEEGKTGFIIPARDSEALAQAILRFLREPSLLKEMGERCRRQVEAYSIDAYADRLIHIITNRLA